MEDQKIIEMLLARNEDALLRIRTAYDAYCHQVARSVLAREEDAQEAVADAMLRVWNSIPPNRPENLKLYLARVTRNCALSILRLQNAQKRGGGQLLVALEELGDCVSDRTDVAEALNKRELARAISDFLRKQNGRDRGIFLHRYFHLESTAQIAEQYAMGEANVLQVLSRIRRKLKHYLIQEGYAL